MDDSIEPCRMDKTELYYSAANDYLERKRDKSYKKVANFWMVEENVLRITVARLRAGRNFKVYPSFS